MIILLSTKVNQNLKNKKTAWEIIQDIPNTVEQRRIDREIAAIERKYEETRVNKQKYTKKNVMKKTSFTNRFYEKDFGFNAGKIWTALNVYGPLNKSTIVKNTKLSLNDFFIGIGWLARENKISKEMNFYKLGYTNLTYEIGENAGKIWRLLDSQGQADISTITKVTDMKIEDIYSAIGWLSRENKIRFLCKEKQLMYELT